MSSTSSPITTPISYNVQDPTPPITLVLTILLVAMFFVGIVSIYFCKYFTDYLIHYLNIIHPPNELTPIDHTPLPLGLDSSIVNSFPTFLYSSVKDYQCDQYGLECAICLCDFEDQHLLRLVTICYHVFHQQCIDLWFESHKSCPVCRRNLDELDHDQKGIPSSETNEETENQERDRDAVSIAVKDDNISAHGEASSSNIITKEDKLCVNYDKFSRSHSTGHSIFKDEKYRLRLPEHVKEIIVRKHNASLSCTTFGEYTNMKDSTEKHKCFGEISGHTN